jgi:hypothetical protein
MTPATVLPHQPKQISSAPAMVSLKSAQITSTVSDGIPVDKSPEIQTRQDIVRLKVLRRRFMSREVFADLPVVV